jgi:hypothetical protein
MFRSRSSSPARESGSTWASAVIIPIAFHQMEDWIGHPVERRRMQRERLAVGDLLGLDRDRLRGDRVRLRDPDQPFRHLQAVQGPRLAGVRVDPKVERLAQQRLQLRRLQYHRIAVRDSSVHDRQAYERAGMNGALAAMPAQHDTALSGKVWSYPPTLLVAASPGCEQRRPTVGVGFRRLVVGTP